MNIETKFSGVLEINDEDILDFSEGILGFEDKKRYVLMDLDEDIKFKALQSVDLKELAFIVMNPWDAFSDYELNIDDDEFLLFGDAELKDLLVYVIVTIRQDSATANLMGPIILNVKTRIGRQIVLHNSSYTTKHIIKLFEKKE